MTAQMETTLNLALALEGSVAPGTDEVRRLTGVADMLESLPDPDIDPRFVARLEAVLMAEFDAKHGVSTVAPEAGLRLVTAQPKVQPTPETATRVAPNVIALPRRRLVIRKAIAGMAAAAMISALPIVAAASSLPGSPFFGIEKFRQNHAISAAHGAEKGFVMEGTARKWIGYGAEMIALEYDANQIDRVLQHAGWLQTGAARIISATGTAAQVERLRAMLAADAERLDRLRDLAPATALPALVRAIDWANELSDRLATGKVVTLPSTIRPLGTVSTSLDAIVEEGTSGSGGSTSKNSTGSGQKSTTTSNTDKTIDQNLADVEEECEIIFREELGDTLVPVSAFKCRVDAANSDEVADLPVKK